MDLDAKSRHDWAQNRILASINPRAYAFFDEHTFTKDMAVGDIVIEDGAPATHVVFPHDGVISCVSDALSGRSVEKASIGNEGFLGLTVILGGGVTFGRYVVQVPGRASWMSVENLDIAFERFECVRGLVLRYAKAFTVQVMESVACNSLHTAQQRVTKWLLEAHDRVQGDHLQITQEILANLLALRRATVNTICSDLMACGAISYHRGLVTIVDRSKLKENACSCYDRISRTGFRTGAE